MIYQQIDDLTQELDTRADDGYHPNPFKFPPATASSNKATTYFPLSFSRNYEKLCKYRISARSLYLASSLLLKIFVLAFAFILLMTGFSFFFQWILGLNSKDLMIELKTITSREKWLVTEFEKFQRNYLRVYSSHEERTKRFKAFCLNMNVLEHRLQQEKMLGIENQTIWGVTAFFDWTEEEMSKLLIPHNYTIKSKTTSMNKISKVQTKRGYIRPKNWDWRDKGVVTHAKNQLNCGSCWAFSVVAMVETIHAIHNGTLIGLSEQQLIDCDSAENGCEGGFRLYALRYIRDKGLLVENAYPYRGNDGKCQLPSGPIDPTQRVFIDNWQSLPSDEEQIADWIATKGPVTFGMNATKSMYHYRGGVFLPSQEECSHESLGSHSMEVVGYGVNDQQIPYWILKNSWGSGYGINGGYLHMRRGVNSCGITREVYSALITR